MFESLGQQLKREREAHKETQRQIAAFLGVDQKVYFSYEHDKLRINDIRLKALEDKWRTSLTRRTPREAEALNKAGSFKERMENVVRKTIETEKEKQEPEQPRDFSELVNEQVEKEKETFRLTTNRLKARLKEETEAKEAAENQLSEAQKKLREAMEQILALQKALNEKDAELSEVKRTSHNCSELIVELTQYKKAFAKVMLKEVLKNDEA